MKVAALSRLVCAAAVAFRTASAFDCHKDPSTLLMNTFAMSESAMTGEEDEVHFNILYRSSVAFNTFSFRVQNASILGLGGFNSESNSFTVSRQDFDPNAVVG